MCLTEAQCGTDLGMVRTRAMPQADGSYRISGNKIFISAGEHDLTENIVHLVLARLPDAPAGHQGHQPVHRAEVPARVRMARRARATALPAPRSSTRWGIKASATCQLNFEDANGWLVGEPHKGMRAMFTMMNSERVSVGVQGLGIAEAAYQSAVAYAKDRLQGRSLAGAKHPDKPADPIIVHPDVRRMLMTMRAYTEGCRALGGWVAQALDHRGTHHRPGGAAARRGFRRADDADREGAVHRSRLRGGQSRRAGLWRARLCPRSRRGAICPRLRASP